MGPKPVGTESNILTQEQFHVLLQRLHVDSEQAALRYEQLHWKLVRFFEWSSCSSAEDLADETINRVARKLHAGETILDFDAFVWGVAKWIRQEGRRQDTRTIPLADVVELTSDGGSTVEGIHNKIQRQNELRCLRVCLARLSANDQALFLAYRVDNGHYKETRTRIAETLGIAPNALRVKILRLRAKLEKCLASCLGQKF